ncbi:MAG: endonuclease III [Candidatus Omnitrophica bacterium]|nr:endonuclease III [Candidatus Omnitrophota bacterium]MDD5487367.1 endonuclease III [Candidatus Omnitrophota bacterium]
MDRKMAIKMFRVLEKRYKGAVTSLEYGNAFQLLAATILSAQCTDERVNKVTATLFRKYGTVKDFAGLKARELEPEIRSTGFYRNKAKNIISSAKMILESFGGKVPGNMEQLVTLPGVARKTANIILYNIFDKNEGIAVDTHVKRVSGRLGLTKYGDPVRIERDLMELFDRDKWGYLSNILIQHGRRTCKARKPDCPGCPVAGLCPSAGKF